MDNKKNKALYTSIIAQNNIPQSVTDANSARNTAKAILKFNVPDYNKIADPFFKEAIKNTLIFWLLYESIFEKKGNRSICTIRDKLLDNKTFSDEVQANTVLYADNSELLDYYKMITIVPEKTMREVMVTLCSWLTVYTATFENSKQAVN